MLPNVIQKQPKKQSVDARDELRATNKALMIS